jgi:acyl-CoA thioesterase FadM
VGLSEPGAVEPGGSVGSVGADTLRADGYRFVVDVVPGPADFDAQGHLNNAATVRLFNDLRGEYARGEIGAEFIEILRRDALVVAAREVHVLYESEGLPQESFVGALRYVRREGKAAVLEQRLVEAATGRAVARAWVLQLLVQEGTVVEWPEVYFARVEASEGREIPAGPRRPAAEWGPP